MKPEVHEKVKDYWDDEYLNFDPSSVDVSGELFTGNEQLDLVNKNLLIISCGTGEHVVRACRKGANVTALDISFNAVENAKKIVEFHDFNAEYIVADAAESGIESSSLDIIWGNSVLHHLDHEKVSKEAARIIKPGAHIIFVNEATFFNPILRFAYEFCFGKGRENRRKQFLFIKRRGDEYEKPIDEEDLVPWRRFFDIELYPHELKFFQKLGSVIFSPNNIFYNLFIFIDNLLLKMFPSLTKYGYEYNFVMKLKDK